ncbi:hypothetical protein [Candidatus Proelusimicrobium volucris]|uniref:hypothetical protein n=1 Tax=Candidatus Proelusimicrobium volucris TaxID=3416225 RepID=UPI003D148706
MRVFKSNTTRIVIACFIIFMAIPFIFVESSGEGRRSDVSIPLETTSNPLSKIIDRIGSFYGFKKRPARASFNKSGAAPSDNGEVLASLKRPAELSSEGRIEGAGLPAAGGDIFSSDGSSSDGSSSGVSVSGGGAVPAGRLPQVKEYVRMDGETYEVVTDPAGRKFVAMPDGFVPYEKLMSDTVSQEEFDAARAQAPDLEDWEIFEALRSPGGLPAYLASGGNNVFYRDDTPGYYDRDGKEGSRLFGLRAGGRGGEEDDIYDERKLIKSIVDNKEKISSKKSGISGGMRVKYVEGKKAQDADNADTQNNNTFASLIENGVIIGDEKVGVKAASNSQRSFRERNKESELDKTIKLKDESVNIYMAKAMGVANFSKEDENGEELKNPWVYPEVLGAKDAPGKKFFDSNANVFEGKEYIKDNFIQSDTLYQSAINDLKDLKNKNNLNIKLAVVDGLEEDGKIKAVSKDTFHYKIISSLIEGEDKFGPYVDIKPADKSDTLLVVSDPDTLNNLKKAGYNAVLFNNYAITPSDMSNFYTSTLKEVANMARLKQEGIANRQEVLAKTKDIAEAKVGIRGI